MLLYGYVLRIHHKNLISNSVSVRSYMIKTLLIIFASYQRFIEGEC